MKALALTLALLTGCSVSIPHPATTSVALAVAAGAGVCALDCSNPTMRDVSELTVSEVIASLIVEMILDQDK